LGFSLFPIAKVGQLFDLVPATSEGFFGGAESHLVAGDRFFFLRIVRLCDGSLAERVAGVRIFEVRIDLRIASGDCSASGALMLGRCPGLAMVPSRPVTGSG